MTLTAYGYAADSIFPLNTTLPSDLVCFSHLRWDFVYQRPQHILSRFASEQRVFFFEEPCRGHSVPRLKVHQKDSGVTVVTPHLPDGISREAGNRVLTGLLKTFFDSRAIFDYVAWYYTPMALDFTRHLVPRVTVYDCMDELASFKFAPEGIGVREAELFRRADVVFTGGQSLYESKKDRHPNVHAMPSSVDISHFRKARARQEDPPDQAPIAGPRLGYFGVIDERMDLDLVRRAARLRPEWQWIFLGPICKIDPADLPSGPNLHFLGQKTYEELPRYLAGWDVALLPFAHNDATRCISPTKTPEYLAAGKPVVSTSIRDVVRPYEELGLVRIADGAEDFVRAAEDLLRGGRENRKWLRGVDQFLAMSSWNRTWARMKSLVLGSLHGETRHAPSQAVGA